MKFIVRMKMNLSICLLLEKMDLVANWRKKSGYDVVFCKMIYRALIFLLLVLILFENLS